MKLLLVSLCFTYEAKPDREQQDFNQFLVKEYLSRLPKELRTVEQFLKLPPKKRSKLISTTRGKLGKWQDQNYVKQQVFRPMLRNSTGLHVYSTVTRRLSRGRIEYGVVAGKQRVAIEPCPTNPRLRMRVIKYDRARYFIVEKPIKLKKGDRFPAGIYRKTGSRSSIPFSITTYSVVNGKRVAKKSRTTRSYDTYRFVTDSQIQAAWVSLKPRMTTDLWFLDGSERRAMESLGRAWALKRNGSEKEARERIQAVVNEFPNSRAAKLALSEN